MDEVDPTKRMREVVAKIFEIQADGKRRFPAPEPKPTESPFLDRPSNKAVWQAAVRNPTALAKLLRSEAHLSKAVRRQIALLVEGKLVRPKRGRGRPISTLAPSLVILEHHLSPLGMAVRDYKIVAATLRSQKRLYGKSKDLQPEIATRHNLTFEALDTALRNVRPIPKFSHVFGDETGEFQTWLAGGPAFLRKRKKPTKNTP